MSPYLEGDKIDGFASPWDAARGGVFHSRCQSAGNSTSIDSGKRVEQKHIPGFNTIAFGLKVNMVFAPGGKRAQLPSR